MVPRYYAVRQLNPCRGVVQVVAVSGLVAHSHDGVTWRLRGDDGIVPDPAASPAPRPIGLWVEGVGLKAGRAEHLAAILPALQNHPGLPFPLIDQRELWLLDQERGLPLALLASDWAGATRVKQPPPAWQPFAPTFTGVFSPSLAGRDALDSTVLSRQRDLLARQVNRAAGSLPAAQWFARDESGDGYGGSGPRIPSAWRGRHLPASAFPELLVREHGNNRLENSVIADYHAYLAPILLCWSRLSLATRTRLEIAACNQRQWLARVLHLLPCRVDTARLQAALVAARLEAAAGGGEPDWN